MLQRIQMEQKMQLIEQQRQEQENLQRQVEEQRRQARETQLRQERELQRQREQVCAMPITALYARMGALRVGSRLRICGMWCLRFFYLCIYAASVS